MDLRIVLFLSREGQHRTEREWTLHLSAVVAALRREKKRQRCGTQNRGRGHRRRKKRWFFFDQLRRGGRRAERKKGATSSFRHAPPCFSLPLSVSLFPFLSLGALRSGCHDALAASPAAAAAAVAAKTESERARELERAREKEERLKKSSMPAASGRKKNQNSRQRLGEDARPVPGHHVEQAPQQTVEGLKEV